MIISVYPLWNILLFLISKTYLILATYFNVQPILVESLPSLYDPQYNILLIPDPLFNTLLKNRV